MTKFESMTARYINELPEHLKVFAQAITGEAIGKASVPRNAGTGTTLLERVNVIGEVYRIKSSAGNMDALPGDDGSRARYQRGTGKAGVEESV